MTDKVTLNNLGVFDPTIITSVNANNTAITTAMNNTLSRDGTFPNQMNASLDMNNHRILNLPSPLNALEPLRLQDLINFTGGTGIVGPTGPQGVPGANGINQIYETKAAVQAATVTGSVQSLRISGYTAAGDGGGAWYKRVVAQPTHNGKIQSADGAWWELSENIINPVMFGADPTGAVDSSAAFQSAYDYNVNGVDIRLNPAHAYKITTAVNLTHPGSITCERTATNNRNLITAGSANNVFNVLSNFVNIKGLSISRAGASAAIAISIGADTRTVNDGAITIGTSTFTSATAAFTSADLGKLLSCGPAGLGGPSFPITTILSPTQVSLAPAVATVTVSGAAATIGFVYTDVVVQDCWIINHNIGIFVGSSQKCSFRNNRCFCFQALVQNVLLWGDLGDHEYIGGTYQSTDDAAGTAFLIISGGGAKLTGVKILGGIDALSVNWTAQSSSLGPFVSGCSIEGGSAHGINIQVNNFGLDGVTIVGCEIGVAGTAIIVPSTNAVVLTHCVFAGNLTRTTGGNTHYDLDKIGKSSFSGNTCAGGGLGTGYVLRANATNNVISTGVTDTLTAVTNLGTGNTIK